MAFSSGRNFRNLSKRNVNALKESLQSGVSGT
jgi:hypothetical protein